MIDKLIYYPKNKFGLILELYFERYEFSDF